MDIDRQYIEILLGDELKEIEAKYDSFGMPMPESINIARSITDIILTWGIRDQFLTLEEYDKLPQIKALQKIKSSVRRDYFVKIVLKLFGEYLIKVEDEIYFILPTHILADGEEFLIAIANTLGSQILSTTEVKRFIEIVKAKSYRIDKRYIDPPSYLLTKNGILNLRTLQRIPFEYELGGTDITIEPPYFRYIDEPFPGWFADINTNEFAKIIRRFYDDDNWDLLLKIIGSILSPDPQRLIAIIHGPPNTGKSLLHRALASVLPIASPNMKELQGYKFGLQDLIGKKAIVVSEKPEETLRIDLIKKLVGGDKITVPRKFKSSIDIYGNFVILLIVNKLPSFTEIDQALIDRIVVVQTQNPVSFEEKDESLFEKVENELREEVANFVLSCYKYFIESGGKIKRDPEYIRQLLFSAEFPFKEFIEDMCIEDPNAKIKREELYNAYIRWAKSNPEKVEGKIYERPKFYAFMRKRYEEVKIKGYFYFKGLRLKEQTTLDQTTE